MKAISLWQPWATAIFHGKNYETRGWKTPYRGTLLIHAAKTWNQICKFSLYEFQDAGILPFNAAENLYPLGVLLGTVELTGCLPTEDIRGRLEPNELRLGDFSDGRFAWRLENKRRFAEPIHFAGKQGLFDVSGPLLEIMINSAPVA
jgi:hypothetical protein